MLSVSRLLRVANTLFSSIRAQTRRDLLQAQAVAAITRWPPSVLQITLVTNPRHHPNNGHETEVIETLIKQLIEVMETRITQLPSYINREVEICDEDEDNHDGKQIRNTVNYANIVKNEKVP